MLWWLSSPCPVRCGASWACYGGAGALREEVLDVLACGQYGTGTSRQRQVLTVELWTVQECARYLKNHEETVREKARGKLIPAVKVGANWRFHPERIAAWVDAGCPSQVEQPALVGPGARAGANGGGP